MGTIHQFINLKVVTNTNAVLDTPGKERDRYLKEPEVIKFFKDNDNKIWSRSEGPGGLSDKKYYSNPNVKIKK